VIDNIERIIEYVNYGPRFASKVLDALTVLIKKIPDREDGKLMIIGTTSKALVLKDLEIVS
jgi:vesicle-fusing ATPase